MTLPQSALVGAMLVATIAALGGQIQLRPGEYAITLEIERAVSREALYEAGFNKEKKLDCFTADELKGPADIAKMFAGEAEEANCKRSGLKTAGSKMTFTTTCQDGDTRIVLDTEMTFGQDSIAILTKEQDGKGAASTIRITATRVGECQK